VKCLARCGNVGGNRAQRVRSSPSGAKQASKHMMTMPSGPSIHLSYLASPGPEQMEDMVIHRGTSRKGVGVSLGVSVAMGTCCSREDDKGQQGFVGSFQVYCVSVSRTDKPIAIQDNPFLEHHGSSKISLITTITPPSRSHIASFCSAPSSAEIHPGLSGANNSTLGLLASSVFPPSTPALTIFIPGKFSPSRYNVDPHSPQK